MKETLNELQKPVTQRPDMTSSLQLALKFVFSETAIALMTSL